MALRSPTEFHNYWGSFALYANLPNVAGSPTQNGNLEAGDTAYVPGSGIYYCITPTLGAAVWGLPGTATNATQLISTPGEWGVPAGVSVNDFIYATGSLTADKADNSGIATMPTIGVVVAKPTAVTATVVYAGEVGGFVGLTPAAIYYVGTAGGITTTPPPSTATGKVVQQVGTAMSAVKLLVMTRLETLL